MINEVVDNGTFLDLKPILLSSYNQIGGPTGWVEQTEGGRSYIKTGNSSGPWLTDLIPHITSTSKIYMETALDVASGDPKLFIMQYVSGTPDRNTYYPALGKTVINVGTSRAISWIALEMRMMKIYRMELRNDGSVPPWF